MNAGSLKKKNQGLKEELEMIREVKATVVSVVIGALGAVTHSLGELLQQILGTTSVQNPQTPAELKEDTPPPPWEKGEENRRDPVRVRGWLRCDQWLVQSTASWQLSVPLSVMYFKQFTFDFSCLWMMVAPSVRWVWQPAWEKCSTSKQVMLSQTSQVAKTHFREPPTAPLDTQNKT